jgi:16S rRNA (cytosine967-C5)-methyltransferase
MTLLCIGVKKPREIAVQILQRYAEQSDYLENLLETALSGAFLAPADRGLAQELTFGVVRWQAALDWLVAQKTSTQPQKTTLQILLRLGLYQIFWLDRVPDHAAVHETVELAKQLGFKSQAGFINAILRGYLRERAETEKKLQDLKSREPALGYSHPDWLVQRWQKRWGIGPTLQLFEWNNTPPPIYARLNSLKSDAESLSALWQNEGLEFVPRGWSWMGEANVFELKSHPPLARLPSFQRGFFYIQDPSTLLAVRALNPQPGESILDFCAAPGGKTTFIAQLMRNQGRIVAQDVSSARLDLVRENCARLGVTCAETTLLRKTSPPAILAPEFDRILVDAPCSNTGVMRRRVDLRWRIRPEEIDRLRRAQLDLLRNAALHLKQAGTLVYSTCSLEPEENEQVIREFLALDLGFQLLEERNLSPVVEGVDGAYVATLLLHAPKIV